MREEEDSIKVQQVRGNIIKSEGGGDITPNNQDLVDMSKNICPLICQWIVQKINLSKTWDKLKEVVS